MGGNLSTITPSSTTAAVDSYVAELGDVQYEKRYPFPSPRSSTNASLSSARFLKTIRGKTRYGHVVVKIFIKPDLSFSVAKWARQLRGTPDPFPNYFWECFEAYV